MYNCDRINADIVYAIFAFLTVKIIVLRLCMDIPVSDFDKGSGPVTKDAKDLLMSGRDL